MKNPLDAVRNRKSEAERWKLAYETHGVKEATSEILSRYEEEARQHIRAGNQDKAIFALAKQVAVQDFRQEYISNIADGSVADAEERYLDSLKKGQRN